MTMKRAMILLSLVAVVLAACGEESARVTSLPPESATTAPGGSGPGSTPGSSAPPATRLSPEHQATIDAAVTDLAARLDVEPAAIELESFTTVVWSDGALGCPKPGEMYTQALVDGSRTVLVADGRTYQYHAADGRPPFLCENPTLEPGPGVTLPPSTDR